MNKLTVLVPAETPLCITLPECGRGGVQLDVTELVTALEAVQCRRSWRCQICDALRHWPKALGRPTKIAFNENALFAALTSFAKDHTTHAVMLLDRATVGGGEQVEGQTLLGLQIVVDNELGDDIAFELRS